MKRKILEILILVNKDKEEKMFQYLIHAYSGICDYLSHVRQIRHVTIDDLATMVSEEIYQLAGIAFLPKSDRKIFEKIFYGNLRKAFDQEYEKIDVPFEILDESAKLYAQITLSKQQEKELAREKAPKARKDLNENQTNEEAEPNVSGISGMITGKNSWIFFAIALNILVVLLCWKYGSKFFGNMLKIGAF